MGLEDLNPSKAGCLATKHQKKRIVSIQIGKMSGRSDILKYLETVLSQWPKNAGATNTSYLFQTYKNKEGNDRCDVYDNVMLLNAITMLSEEPHSMAVAILSFINKSIDWISKNLGGGLVGAAYVAGKPDQKINLCWDLSCRFQDVGNNSLMLLAMLKFQHKFPNHPESVFENIRLILSNIENLECKNGYKGRIDKDYVSCEHMIDLFAVCNLLQNNFADRAKGDDMKRWKYICSKTSNFVKSMYQEKSGAYLIGSKVNCQGLNFESPQPIDTQTWAMLAGVDDQEDRKNKSLTYAYENFIVTFQNGTLSVPGVKFTILAESCPQFENTGAYVCALAVHRAKFGQKLPPEVYTNAERTVAYFAQEIKENRAFHGTKGTPNCPTGLGWSYYDSPHLVSTVYCALAAICFKGDICNPYQLSTESSPTIPPVVKPTPTPAVNPTSTPAVKPTPTPAANSTQTHAANPQPPPAEKPPPESATEEERKLPDLKTILVLSALVSIFLLLIIVTIG